jgi:hypothetical protein
MKHLSSDQIKKNEMRGHIARMGDRRGVYRDFVGKSASRRALGRPRRRWQDNIKMELQ